MLKRLLQKTKSGNATNIVDFVGHIIVYAFLFTGIGWLLPELYFEMAPAEAFYKLDSPAQIVQETYKPCAKPKVIFHRWSNIDADAKTTIELILIDNKTEEKIDHQVRDFVIDKTKAEGIVQETSFVLPCDIVPGQYHYKGVINFTIKGKEKHELWFTSNFTVT